MGGWSVLGSVGRGLGGGLIAVVYPPRCAGCGRRGGWLCSACDARLPRFVEPWCPRCGIPPGFGRCRCGHTGPSLDLMRSVGPFDGWLRQAVHALKYEGESARAEHLGRVLATALPTGIPVDALVPVPLHPARLRRRGFNQAQLLAERVGAAASITVVPALRRTRATDPQVGLGARQRAANVLDAFAVVAGVEVGGGHLLLVDDVVTTGSTLSACAAVLKGAGARFVGAVTLGREID